MREFELLQTIYATASKSSDITIGPGDDMGELLIQGTRFLSAVDHLIVGRHVEEDCLPEEIGRKAIARCFSDIAAMAGTPVACLMTACIPSSKENDWCEKVFQSARDVADKWGGPIFGGDIASCDNAPPIFTVTAFATPPPQGAITRNGAQHGDFVCVTGELGNSIKGHHLSFTPRIKEAKELLEILGMDLHSMIDISDGLGQDASHLSTDSLQLKIDLSSLPLRKEATVEQALQDGEDYELLFTCKSAPPDELATVIGIVESGSNHVVTSDGKSIADCGWEHA